MNTQQVSPPNYSVPLEEPYKAGPLIVDSSTTPMATSSSRLRAPSLHQRWAALSRSNRIIIIADIVLLLILIIGLAAGLGSRHSLGGGGNNYHCPEYGNECSSDDDCGSGYCGFTCVC